MYFRHYLRYNICIKTKNRKKGQKTSRRIVVQLKNGVFFYWNEPAAKRSVFGHFGLDVRFFNTAQHLTVVKDV